MLPHGIVMAPEHLSLGGGTSSCAAATAKGAVTLVRGFGLCLRASGAAGNATAIDADAKIGPEAPDAAPVGEPAARRTHASGAMPNVSHRGVSRMGAFSVLVKTMRLGKENAAAGRARGDIQMLAPGCERVTDLL